MAPTTTSSKMVPHNRPRQVAPRAIVPAIPLPYMQKKRQQVLIREKVQENILPTQNIEAERTPTPPATDIIPEITNGSSDGHELKKDEEIVEPVEVVEAVEQVIPEASSPAQEQEVQELANKEEKEEADEAASFKETTIPEVKAEEQHERSQSVPSDPPSSASRSTFHMPPPFVPANHNAPSNFGNSGTMQPPSVFNGHYPIHHARPSNGSLVFGGYPESNNSSPAPPPSAGNIPPYPYQQQAQMSRHGPHLSNGSHSHPVQNGFSQMGPPAPQGYYPRPETFMNQGPMADSYPRRPMIHFGPPDGYSPSPTPGFDVHRPVYDPSTPHSFRGSQSSALNEQEGAAFYGQHPNAAIPNRNNDYNDEGRPGQPEPTRPRSEPQQVRPAGGNFDQNDSCDGLLYYLQTQFADAEFADYVLELRYSDDHAPPVRIPGHNLMFARSPKLKSLIVAQAQESNDLTVKALFIESNDRFLRSDGFWMAVQRLYGGALLDLGAAAIHNLPSSAGQTTPTPGTPAERFDLALGYAAAGHILGIHTVVSRGVEIAGILISWDTVEKALDFALDGGLHSQWTPHPQAKCTNTYSPHSNMLTVEILNFLTGAFPPNFELDVSVGDPTFTRRLPRVPEGRPAANPRLSSIKFGDHSAEESVNVGSGNATFVILSKVLINLPFYLLKYVLESPRLGNALRLRVMYAVIEEREKRRLKVVSSPYASEQNSNSQDDSVRWQEIFNPHGGPEGTPILTRTWIENPTASGSVSGN